MSSVDPSFNPGGSAVQSSPGRLLRAAREARGIHLAMLSVALKVPTSKLEALEKDDHGVFQDVTFLRALAQAVCRHLGIDSAPVLAGLPRAVPVLPVQRALLAGRMPTPSRDERRRNGLTVLPSKTVLLLAGLMLAASAALIWWPAEMPYPFSSPVGTEETAAPPAQMGQSSYPAELSLVPGASEPAVPAALSVTASADVSQVTSLTVASPSNAVAASGGPALPEGAAAASAPRPFLQLHAKADTWIEVRDSTAQPLLKRLVKGGETLRLDARPPVFVYVGRAESTELVWQGQVLDLRPYTQNNEARLKIQP